MDLNKILVSFLVFVFCSSSLAMIDEEKPLWELGISGGVFNLPDYPGADEDRTRMLGLPYFIYRGQTIRAGDGSILTGRFLNSERLRIEMSASAAFPVSSRDNVAREDMPDLDWIGEVGPNVVYHLIPKSKISELDLNFPIRFVFSTDFGRVDDLGFLFAPGFEWVHKATFNEKIRFVIIGNIKFTTSQLMDYFYEVEAKYAKPGRPEFEAKSGYLGSELSFAVTQEFNENLVFFSAVQTQYFRGASNLDSPLHLRKMNTGMVIGFAWIAKVSKKRAYKYANQYLKGL